MQKIKKLLNLLNDRQIKLIWVLEIVQVFLIQLRNKNIIKKKERSKTKIKQIRMFYSQKTLIRTIKLIQIIFYHRLARKIGVITSKMMSQNKGKNLFQQISLKTLIKKSQKITLKMKVLQIHVQVLITMKTKINNFILKLMMRKIVQIEWLLNKRIYNKNKIQLLC